MVSFILILIFFVAVSTIRQCLLFLYLKLKFSGSKYLVKLPRLLNVSYIISKSLFGVIVWTKIATKILYVRISALKVFIASLGLPGSFLGFP